ncbi:hypothetical protein [Pandoravirus japonicus]|uniref:Uncharacterized protein n=1 Tax=Pandoravirus japonicus TaxID=2823154 RepID=A0A811BL92_9VIRU|nr:hypothetical protein [Pandoravirus japonicus]
MADVRWVWRYRATSATHRIGLAPGTVAVVLDGNTAGKGARVGILVRVEFGVAQCARVRVRKRGTEWIEGGEKRIVRVV